MFNHLINYINLGYAIFPAYSAINSNCTCGNPDCKSKGKHSKIGEGPFAATKSIKKIETIKIEASSGRIVQMNISIRKNGRERLLSEITFEGENNISPSPKIFDYKTTGFVFSHKIKE